ncbi:MAG: DNA-directed DNA polymerase [Nanoarchaeota archaeon]|nr:DNA-directed DNA polymerase [Nanoarchaeota archaeon]MBU4493224.1 DNA-directed DNA polymerase [Nanoarchaeota archaeon]
MVEIQFYPIDISYSIEQGKAVINLFGKTVDGKQICVQDDSFEPYFWVVSKKDSINKIVEKIEKIRVEKDKEISIVTKTEVKEKKFFGKNITAIKVFTKLPRDVNIIRNEIKNFDVETYEFDIPFTRRYLIDKDIIPLTLCKAEGEFINKKLRVSVMKAEKVEHIGDEVIENPRILAFDIETYNPSGKGIDAKKDPIVMISFYGDKLSKVITWKRFKTDNKCIEFVESELDLINKFKEVIGLYKPDIITGYFSDGFDFPYIEERARKYKINLDICLDYSSLKINKRGITTTKLIGIAHLDIFKFIRKIMGTTLETDTYSLNSVAEEILGEKKNDINLDNLAFVWDNKPEQLEEFCDYNLQDSKLTFMLCKEIMTNIVELVKIVGLPIVNVSRMSFSQLDEWYLIKQANAVNEIVPNKPTYDEIRERRKHTYKGAFVFKPTPGLYKDIIIFDFRSLYPSIITSHNISPDTLNCRCCEDEKHVPGFDKCWFCSKKKGFISTVLESIITRRMRVKEIMKGVDEKKLKLFHARQYALKTIGNSMYGYMGFFGARWYSIECARSITAYGRYYIQKVIEDAKNAGFKVLYSDTDSVFLVLDGKTRDDTKKFVESINANLPGIMEIEYEGFYPRGIFVSAKEGAYGAKKKYALLSEDNHIIIKGFETIRRNWSFIAKETQKEVLNIILKDGDPKKAFNYVKNIIDNIKKKEIPIEKVIIHTQLQKSLGEYDSIGPHVAVAQRMVEKGIPVGPGSIIEYVITKGKDKEKIRDRAKLPEEISKDDYDPDYYINNQIIPSVEKIFEVLGFEKDDLIKSLNQSRLDTYFK